MAKRKRIYGSLPSTEMNDYGPIVSDVLIDGKAYVVKHDGSYEPPAPPSPSTKSPMYLEAVQANSTVGMSSFSETAPNLEYSTDGVMWQAWGYTDHEVEPGTGIYIHIFDTITLGEVDDKVYLRGDNPSGFSQDEERISGFVVYTGLVNIGGNVMSLIDKNESTTIVPDYGFYRLFSEANISKVDVLRKITKVGVHGCQEMFYSSNIEECGDFENLTEIGHNGCMEMFRSSKLQSSCNMPKLVIVGENGLGDLYNGCSDMVTISSFPQLAEIGEYGCAGMCYGCTSLTFAADMPVLTTIGDHGCQEMYLDCTSLTSAADMPTLTTIGEGGCARMYSGCTSLTAAADMPSLTTIGGNGCFIMYKGCTSLTSAADMPALTTIGDNGCIGMYNNCTFDMSDDGTTLNFAFPTPPITAGDYTYSTAYDVAQWMGNTNGFGGGGVVV